MTDVGYTRGPDESEEALRERVLADMRSTRHGYGTRAWLINRASTASRWIRKVDLIERRGEYTVDLILYGPRLLGSWLPKRVRERVEFEVTLELPVHLGDAGVASPRLGAVARMSRECKRDDCPVNWRHYHVIRDDITSLPRRYPPDTGERGPERKPRRGILGRWARR